MCIRDYDGSRSPLNFSDIGFDLTGPEVHADGEIWVASNLRVQWANQMMDRIVPQKTRLQAPVVETVRDPDFLEALRGASQSRNVRTARADSGLRSYPCANDGKI